MFTLLINMIANETLLMVLGIIAAILEGIGAIIITTLKAVTIFKSNHMSDQEKVQALEDSLNDIRK